MFSQSDALIQVLIILASYLHSFWSMPDYFHQNCSSLDILDYLDTFCLVCGSPTCACAELLFCALDVCKSVLGQCLPNNMANLNQSCVKSALTWLFFIFAFDEQGKSAKELSICFSKKDVHWILGYCFYCSAINPLPLWTQSFEWRGEWWIYISIFPFYLIVLWLVGCDMF